MRVKTLARKAVNWCFHTLAQVCVHHRWLQISNHHRRRCTITLKFTAAKKDGLFERLDAAVQSSSKAPAISFMISEDEIEGLDIVDLVAKCYNEKKVCSFGVARKVALNTPQIADRFSAKGFRKGKDVDLLTAAFKVVCEKGDALLVNAQGMHSEKVADQHAATLREWGGFDELFEHRQKVLQDQLEKLQRQAG